MRVFGNTLSIILLILILAFPVIGWVQNITKLAACDFEAPYKAEVVHFVREESC